MKETRPALLLVAVDMGRYLGTEPGKAWNWACALARHYRLHVITAPAVAERCRGEDLAADWSWHLTTEAQPVSSGRQYYRDYARWCRSVSDAIAAGRRAAGPAPLHHITLGSFRVLPRYDRLGLDYSIGPLGGGESVPAAYLRTARMPWRPWATELVRPWLNNACAIVPHLRSVMSGARLALGTTRESETILRRMGARRTGVVFPDRVPRDVDPNVARPARERAAELSGRMRLIWAGRALWWKGGQLAVELLRRLVAANVDCEMTMYSYGPALESWQRQIAAAGVGARCRVQGFLPRAELLRELGGAHAFVYPTLHDSSSSALLEAYALGVPSLTVGVGGPAVVATPETGYNHRAPDLEAWLDGAVAQVIAWRKNPATWLAASEAAQVRARHFGESYLERAVEQWLSPEAQAR